MNWSFLENILTGVNKYSTVIGRIWLSVVFLFRILVYVAAAEQVWKDEQKDFVCNTQQPGCENACFDHFFPISQVRLWALQLIIVSTPSLLVALHVAYREHREAKHKRKLYKDKGSIDGGLFYTYTISLVFKTAFEVGSLLAFYFLYNGLEVPILLRCSQNPCPNTVDCYIAKATEKKVFLYIMGCTSILCITLNFVELMYILWKQLCKCFTRRYIPMEEKAFSQCQPPVSIVNKFASNQLIVNTEDSTTQPASTAKNQPVQSLRTGTDTKLMFPTKPQ
ncbi:gap junction beta-7 protein [Chaetodon trifascialis]|uniref:gap junction beta-7 protein n=1 Tax=Chaetodon trifascialis TaxID=109706 RepID=UPI00399251B8